MKVALICNTPAAFNILDILYNHGLLVGVGVVEQKNDFYSDITYLCNQSNVGICKFTKQHLALDLNEWLKIMDADIVLVLGFPYKIPAQILEKNKTTFYNIHFGQLPKYGGGFPLFWQIKNQENSGMLTIHKMDSGFDTGPIALELPLEIHTFQNYGIVEMNYAMMAIHGVFQLINTIFNQTLVLKPQTAKDLTYYSKPTLKDLIINWQTMDAKEIVALIKSCNPWNKGAIARIIGLDVKVVDAKIGNLYPTNVGQILSISDFGMEVSCANNTTLIVKILYTPFGYFQGENLADFGLQIGDVFDSILI